MKKINLTIAALILVLFTIPAISQTPEERGGKNSSGSQNKGYRLA